MSVAVAGGGADSGPGLPLEHREAHRSSPSPPREAAGLQSKHRALGARRRCGSEH